MQSQQNKINTFIGHLHKNKLARTLTHFLSKSSPKDTKRNQQKSDRYPSWNKSKTLLSPDKMLKKTIAAKSIHNQKNFIKSGNQIQLFSRRSKQPKQTEKVTKIQIMSQNKLGESVGFKEGFSMQNSSKERKENSSKEKSEFSVFNRLIISDKIGKSQRQKSTGKLNGKSQDRLFTSKSSPLQQSLLQIAKTYNPQNLANLLVQISKNPNIHHLRIYKQTFKRMYIHRYGKDRITSFFNFEYIEDYDSIDDMMREHVLRMNHEEILVLCFMIFDQDGDGLISNHDLFRITTLNEEENLLINKDVYVIVRYVVDVINAKCKQNQPKFIKDQVHQHHFIKNDQLTLNRYRTFTKKLEKEIMESIMKVFGNHPNRMSKLKSLAQPTNRAFLLSSMMRGESPSLQKIAFKNTQSKKTIITRKISDHMFSLQNKSNQQEDQEEFLKKIVRITLKETQNISQNQFSFKLSFERFQQIFENKIPELYYDLIFAVGGLRLENKTYNEVYIENIEDPQNEKKKIGDQKQKKDLNFYQNKLKFLKDNYRNMNIASLKTIATTSFYL